MLKTKKVFAYWISEFTSIFGSCGVVVILKRLLIHVVFFIVNKLGLSYLFCAMLCVSCVPATVYYIHISATNWLGNRIPYGNTGRLCRIFTNQMLLEAVGLLLLYALLWSYMCAIRETVYDSIDPGSQYPACWVKVCLLSQEGAFIYEGQDGV